MNSLSPLIEGEGREFSDVSTGLPLKGQPFYYLWAEFPRLFLLCVKGEKPRTCVMRNFSTDLE